MLPAAVSRPTANAGVKPFWMSTGYSRPPSARIVTAEAPVNDVKNAHTSTVATAAPPGSQPAASWNTATRRVGVLPRASSVPASVKRGIVGSSGDETMS